MNIWAWVDKLQDDLREAGQTQSAISINRLSDHVADLEIERAAALLPEVKAINKTLHNPWLDVFTRHWEMRNRLGNSMEGETALADAVSLFEAAHREDTIDCPQSVCVTQDLATCYANMDGPGWVPERIEVCDETMARIDPSWSCFQCLTVEKSEALLDARRYDDVMAYVDEQERKINAAGEEDYGGLGEMRVRALLAMGRPAEALTLIEAAEAKIQGGEWKNTSQPRALAKSLALAELSRDEEALEALPAYNDLAPRYRKDWLRTVYCLLKRAPERNTWSLGSTVYRMLAEYSRQGTHRLVIELTDLAVRMAIQRGSVWSARRHLALARSHVPKLKADCGANELLNELEALIRALPEQDALPVPAADLIDWLDREDPERPARDPEVEVQWLLRAQQERPEDMQLLETTVGALQACSAESQGMALLWTYVREHAAEENPMAYQLLNLLLDEGEHDQVRRLADLYRPAIPLVALWCEARMAERLGDWPQLELTCRDLLALDAERHGARELLARALMQQQRFDEAAACYQALASRLEQPRSSLWDQMTAASCAGDWASVRQAAAQLSIELSSQEGVIEEDGGWAIVRFIENGEAVEYYARRTGPVTARVVENASPQHTQHVGDWVVFDAGMLYPAPEDEQERERFVPTYPVVHVLEKGVFGPSWLVDGIYPGDEAFAALREVTEAEGWQLWVHSSDTYLLSDAEHPEQEALPGVLFTIAIQSTRSPADLHKVLLEVTRHWPHPMCWLRLADHCQADVQPHHAVIERYGL
ncbi:MULTISPECIES: hypothetical protein [unclassified Pseudomonas]|uniref:hypothetical protein n=1 Tax=unclassified Pseudomonas TaxID=196821 RepID=UPI0025E02527|nr:MULTISPECIES: hypothetical protein [unclassified Pseudomonas]